ncbi:MAG: hypothetical protein Q8850_02800, partial [Candidatus Phytoplasma australasiaticum]|nr:hypothetical protein [Candidatus Phytoplasma australasiaticum]
IEKLYKQPKLNNLKHKNISDISHTISNIEKIKGDVLNSQELDSKYCSYVANYKFGKEKIFIFEYDFEGEAFIVWWSYNQAQQQ